MSRFISAAPARGLLAVVAGAALVTAGCSGSSHDREARRSGHPSPTATPSASTSVLPSQSASGSGGATQGNASTGGNAGSTAAGAGPSGQERVMPSQPPKDAGPKGRTVEGAMQIEGICKILVSGFDRWVLLGSGVSDLRNGERVQVVGTPSPTEENPCDGAVLHVDSIRRM